MDAQEFPGAGADETGTVLSVYRFSSAGLELRVKVEAVKPQIEAVVNNSIRVSTDQVQVFARVNYTIKRAGVFALKLGLPEGYRVECVGGSNILQHVKRTEQGASVLELTLKERTSGDYSVTLELVKNLKQLPASLSIEEVHPLGTVKLAGFVGVSAESGVALRTGALDGLTEIPAAELPESRAPYSRRSTSGLLAYKFITAQPGELPDWKLSVATETIAAWVRAEVVNTFSLSQTLVSGRAFVRYEIANAPVKELREVSGGFAQCGGQRTKHSQPRANQPCLANRVAEQSSGVLYAFGYVGSAAPARHQRCCFEWRHG